jgi:hypothetical protein
MAQMTFNPQSGAEPWTADVHEANGSGYDVVLFLDKVAKTDDSGWMLELAIEKDGSLNGQITAHPGYDALAIFDCNQRTMHIVDNSGGPVHTLTDAVEAIPPHVDTITAAALMAKVRAAVNAARAVDDHLNDPEGDGSGRGAQSPDGDSYNELWGAFDALFELVPRAE